MCQVPDIKFSLCVRLQKDLKETACVGSDVYSHLSQKMTIINCYCDR